MTTLSAKAETPASSAAQMGMLRALWEFSRPHTIIGTTLACFVLYAIAADAAGAQAPMTLAITYAASLTLNIYIVGLNQLTDVDIDRINKPYLPIAAGAISFRAGVGIVVVCGVAALSLAAAQGKWLLGTIGTVFFLGTIYSLPPLRLKRFPFGAAAAITLARAIVGNAGVYLVYSESLTGTAALSPQVILFIGFMFLFVICIAIMKDIPDIEGDRRHAIPTFVLRLGPGRTLRLCQGILTVAYIGVVVAAVVGAPGVNLAVLAIGHVLALIGLWALGLRLDGDDGGAVYRYYMFIWKLFYFEFLLFPVACFLG